VNTLRCKELARLAELAVTAVPLVIPDRKLKK